MHEYSLDNSTMDVFVHVFQSHQKSQHHDMLKQFKTSRSLIFDILIFKGPLWSSVKYSPVSTACTPRRTC